MSKSRAISVKPSKPVSPLLKPVKLDYSKFFKALFNGTKSLVTHEWSKVVSEIMDGAGAVNLATTPEELAHILLERSVTKALVSVIGETNLRSLTENNDRVKSIDTFINDTLNNSNLLLDRNFFDRPSELEIISLLQKVLREWLVEYGIKEASAENISRRLPNYFQASLIDEWRKNPARYAPILDALDSPFSKAGDRELGWKNYEAHLQQQIDRSVFDEAFSLSQIYIPLNAYFLDHKKNSPADSEMQRDNRQRTRVVVDLQQELIKWLKTPNRDDLLRVISGGPGSGKSTFARMFAAHVSQTQIARVLFVELHKIDATKDLPSEIARYVRDEELLAADPLDPDNPERNLLIILDGLDELASQGRIAAETARAFVGEVERTLRRKNEREVKLRILLSGREMVIQENESEFRGARQILTLIAYYLTEEEGRSMKDTMYRDPDKLLDLDLRQIWWKKYGELTGNSNLTGLPDVLERPGLSEVVAQPLLNYLVALSFTRGKVRFDKTVNLNVVYADLVEAVYERGYDRNRRHVSVSHLNFDEFQRVLEEVALAAWHGDGRSTTVREIQEHCRASNLTALLEKFQEGASAGVTRLLAAFFFRQHGERANTGDRTFIFTHKSFGEFLAACRIARAAERIVKQRNLRKDNLDEGWNEREAMMHWVTVCGPSACTSYIKDFILGELRRRPEAYVDTLRNDLAALFSYVVHHASPMEMTPVKSFQEAAYHARNAEETLLVVMNASAVATEKLADIELGAPPTAFGAWFRKIQGQRSGAEPSLAARSLSYLNLAGAVLDIADLYNADLSCSNLRGLVAHFANFGMCNLTNADIRNSKLLWSTFDGANLSGADLRDADLSGAIFCRKATPDNKGAHIQNLGEALLQGTNFSRASLVNTEFQTCELTRKQLESADFSVAIIKGGSPSDKKRKEVVS